MIKYPILCLLTFMLGCSESLDSEVRLDLDSSQPDDQIAMIVESLNNWNLDELLCLNGGSDASRRVSGETLSYVENRLKKAKSIGFDVRWSEETSQYYAIRTNKGVGSECH